MSRGNQFHASGADTVTKRRPKFVAVETTTGSPGVDDHSPLLPLTAETGWRKSARYCRVRPRAALRYVVTVWSNS